jgi:hypothetical protein
VSVLAITGLLAGAFFGEFFSALILVGVYTVVIPLLVGWSLYTGSGAIHAIGEIGILILSTQAGYFFAGVWFTIFRAGGRLARRMSNMNVVSLSRKSGS